MRRSQGYGRKHTGVRATAVRASYFYGPDVVTSVLSIFGVARLLAGKPAFAPYRPITCMTSLADLRVRCSRSSMRRPTPMAKPGMFRMRRRRRFAN